MIYNEFGQLGERVSALGFGAASLSGSGGGYGFGAIEDESAIDLVHSAMDLGVNLYDTAPIYGFGESERRLGIAMSGRRDGQLLVSKCGVAFDDNKNVRIDNSATTTRIMLENSLRRLQVDMIDAYLVHWPDPHTDIRETMEVLVRAKESGLIRYIGLSNTNAEELSKAREVGVVDLVQLESSFLVPGRLDELESSEDLQQMGVMSWGTLAKGILTGRVTRQRTYDPLDVRHSAPWWVNADHEPAFKIMDQIGPKLEAYGHTGLELALGYLMARRVVDTQLCGVRSLNQLESAIEALDKMPSEEVITACVAIRDRVWRECGIEVG